MTRTRAEIGRSSRMKGKRTELEAGRIMDKLYPEFAPWKRTARGEHQDKGDLLSSVQLITPMHVEVKSRKTVTMGSIHEWWENTKALAKDCKPILLIKVNHQPWMIIAPHDDPWRVAQHGLIPINLR